MNLRNRLSLYYYCVKRVFADEKQLSKGQKNNYELLQLSHRLEKGLLIRNPKPLWGWEKAYKIVELLKDNNDVFSSETAKAVLSAFLKVKEKSFHDKDRIKCKEFFDRTNFSIENNNKGGTICVEKVNFIETEIKAIEKLFYSRHSCRDFSDKTVSNDDISKAIKMALRCPSACNRQPFKVYVISPSKLEDIIGRNLQYKCDKLLIVTGDVRAFTAGELLDWLISPSLFAAYLTLSLHTLGIGSCIIRKDLVKDNMYNKTIKDITCMTDSERIVLEMYIGYYNDKFIAPVSNRFDVSDVVRYI